MLWDIIVKKPKIDCTLILYMNHRGEVRVRKVTPLPLDKPPVACLTWPWWFGESPWHKGDQWFLHARDQETGSVRDFALNDILAWGPESVKRAKERIKLGVGIIAVHDDCVLLGLAAEPSSVAGLWQVPAGGVAFGEDLLSAAQRELLEETGAYGAEFGQVGIAETLSDKKGRHLIMVHYRCRVADRQVTPNHEFQRLIWADRAQVIDYSLRGMLTPMTRSMLAEAGWEIAIPFS